MLYYALSRRFMPTSPLSPRALRLTRTIVMSAATTAAAAAASAQQSAIDKARIAEAVAQRQASVSNADAEQGYEQERDLRQK